MSSAAKVGGVFRAHSLRADALTPARFAFHDLRRICLAVLFVLVVIAGSIWSVYNIEYSDALSAGDAHREAVVTGRSAR